MGAATRQLQDLPNLRLLLSDPITTVINDNNYTSYLQNALQVSKAHSRASFRLILPKCL